MTTLEADLSDVLCVSQRALRMRADELELEEGTDFVNKGKTRAYTEAGAGKLKESYGLKPADPAVGGHYDPNQPHAATPAGAQALPPPEKTPPPIVTVRALRPLPNRMWWIVRLLGAQDEPTDTIVRMKVTRPDAAARIVAGRKMKAIDMVGYMLLDPIELRRRGA